MVLEAMAAGLPVLATSVGGMREAVTDGLDGIVIEPCDFAALTDAISRLCADAGLRRRLGARARVTVEARFTTRHCAEAHVRAYRLAAARAVARRRGGRLAKGGAT